MADSCNTLPTEGDCERFLRMLAELPHFLSRYKLTLGRAWAAAHLPADQKRGLQGQCFANAGALALSEPDLTYVEGYGCPSGLIPVEHAWCVDRSGRVIDPTWKAPETASYFGVPLTHEFLVHHYETASHWGIFGEHPSKELLYRILADRSKGPWALPLADTQALETELAALFCRSSETCG